MTEVKGLFESNQIQEKKHERILQKSCCAGRAGREESNAFWGFGTLVFGGTSAYAAASDIVTYNAEGGTITWDFSSVLSMMFTALGAAMAAGALIWVALKGYQIMKKMLSGR